MSTPRRAFGAMGSHTVTGSALPFAKTDSASRCSMAFSVSRRVASSTRIPSGGAALCSREAVLSTSPAASCSPCSGRAFRLTSASPVAAPTRTDSPSDGSSAFSSEIASRTASAARTARSASSSWAIGAPKTATTASPMNFSTVPPKRSSSAFARAWYGARKPRTSSGSRRSERPVKSTRSTKTAVTTFRSSAATRCSSSREAPQDVQ